MATIPFQASLTSPITLSTDVQAMNNCTSLLLGDDSNYGTNNDNACAPQLFNAYRTYVVTHYSGTVYNLSSLFSPPTCTQAYLGTAPSLNLTTGDGWLSVTLVTIPTWNIGSNYNANYHQVYNPTDKNVYTCATTNLAASGNRPDLSPTIWTLVPNTNPLLPIPASAILPIYQATSYFALLCNSSVCLPQMISNALCQNGLDCNNATLCTNDAFMDALKVLMLTYSIQTANSLNRLQFTTNQFDLLNKLCNC